MSVEEFSCCAKKIKKELYGRGLKRVMILGGEPFLNPNILEIVSLAEEIFNEKDIALEVLTNGILIKDYYKEIKKWKKTTLLITPYPKAGYSDEVYSFLENKKADFMASRLLFSRVVLNKDGGEKDSEYKKISYNNCGNYSIPCLCVRDYKIFICPLSATIHIFNKKYNENIPIEKGDYIPVDDLSYNLLKDFVENGPENICKFCNNENSNGSIFWDRGGKFPVKEYYSKENPKELFLLNFKEFDIKYNGTNLIKYFKNNNIFGRNEYNYFNMIDPVFSESQYEKIKKRINCNLDIIVPFYNGTQENIDVLFKTLSEQTIIDDCCIYLISDNSKIEDRVFEKFFKSELNVIMLKNEKNMGPGYSRQLGVDSSFGKFLLFLDFDDFLLSKKSLETMIKKSKGYDIVVAEEVVLSKRDSDYYTIDYRENDGGEEFGALKHSTIFKRSFLDKFNIRQKNIYMCEDLDFFCKIKDKNPKILAIKEKLYAHIRGYGFSLGDTTGFYEKAMYRLLVTIENNILSNSSQVEIFLKEIEIIMGDVDKINSFNVRKSILISLYYLLKKHNYTENALIVNFFVKNSLNINSSYVEFSGEKISISNLENVFLFNLFNSPKCDNIIENYNNFL